MIFLFVRQFIKINKSKNNMMNDYRNEEERINASMFNIKFSNLNGTQPKFFTEKIIDYIIDSNSKNTRKIKLKYNNNLINEEEMENIKDKMVSDKYNIKYEYSSDGYISTVIVDEKK